MLGNYDGSLDTINQVIYTGALTTVTPDGKPRTGVASKSGNKYMNGIKFVADGQNQASMLCVAYGDELVGKIEKFLEKQPIDPQYNRPFARILVQAKLQNNNFTDDMGIKKFNNELVITNIWNAPQRGAEVFEYSNSSQEEE